LLLFLNIVLHFFYCVSVDLLILGRQGLGLALELFLPKLELLTHRGLAFESKRFLLLSNLLQFCLFLLLELLYELFLFLFLLFFSSSLFLSPLLLSLNQLFLHLFLLGLHSFLLIPHLLLEFDLTPQHLLLLLVSLDLESYLLLLQSSSPILTISFVCLLLEEEVFSGLLLGFELLKVVIVEVFLH
jgi:hypothetical protein